MPNFGNDAIIDAKERPPFDGAPTFSLRNRIRRATYQLVWFIFARWTPPQLFSWRNIVLRAFGAKLDHNAKVYSSVQIWLPENLSIGKNSTIGPGAIIYNMAPIEIGERVVISQGAHLCAGTHDFRDKSFQLTAMPIRIGHGAWIATEAFVGPGVNVKRDAVLGARGVATSDLAANQVYAGNPARHIAERYRS